MVELNFDTAGRPRCSTSTGSPNCTSTAAGTADPDRRAVPYTRIIAELGAELPGLAMAARTVGSPQIRNRGSVGGNLGAASPAGDAHPALLAADADVEIASVRGTRSSRRRTSTSRQAERARTRRADHRGPPRPREGPQQFSKVGTRNAMVIAVCAFGLALHPAQRRVGTGLGSAAPTPAGRAPRRSSSPVSWTGTPRPLSDSVLRRFGALVAEAASPIDDVRGSAAYRRHALSVLARRTLGWAWSDYTRGGRHARERDRQRGETRSRRRLKAKPALRACVSGSASRVRRTPANKANAGPARLYLDGVPACSCWSRPPGGGPRRAHGRSLATATGSTRSRSPLRKPALSNVDSARPGSSSPRTNLIERNNERATRKSGKRLPGTCAAAPATRRSWTRSGSPPRAARQGGAR